MKRCYLLLFLFSTFLSLQGQVANQLLRTGTMEEFADTPIVTSGGIRFSVGSAQQQLFSETDRVLTALDAASQAGNGIIASGWQVTSQFEEWTDRLILRKAVTFEMIQGSAFHDYLNQDGATFANAANVVNENDAAISQMELEQKAAQFIANGRHLQLYTQARTAAGSGAQALLNELANDRGPVTITETIVFGRIIPRVNDASEAAAAIGNRLANEPAGVTIPLVSGAGLNGLGNSMVLRAPALDSRAPLIAGGISRSTYTAERVNGFTIGEDWSREVHYERSWISFRTSVFASFGLGVRIPWKATVETSPRYITSTQPDKTPFDASISIETINADSSFYRDAGLPTSDLHDGQELVIKAGAGITLKVILFDETILNRGRSNPLVGRNLDLGSHFDPPMNGASASAGSPTLLYEDTGLAWQNWLAGIGCDMRANIELIGHRFDLDVAPHNAWLVSSISGRHSQATWSQSIANQNVAMTQGLAVDDQSPAQTARTGQRYYHHGVLYSNASYKVDMDVVPAARLRATLKLSNIIPGLSNLNLSTPWVNLFTASFDLPSLETHPGTADEIQAWADNRRYLPTGNNPMGHVQRQIIQGEANANSSTWTVQLTEEVPLGSGVLKEFIPLGFTVNQILGGGTFDHVERSIVWQIQNENPPNQVGYTLTGSLDLAPALLGQWQAQGQSEPLPTLSANQQDLANANLQLLVRELAQRPTFQQMLDGRSGSVIITAGPDNQARIRLQLETSEDLQNWSATPETVATPLEVTQPMTGGKKWFRFRLKD